MTRDKRISPLIDDAGDITHVQVAIDGRWEDARRVPRTDGADAVGNLASVLRPHGELAVEVFAADAHGCQTFVGVRVHDIAKEDATDLLRALLEVVARESVMLSDVTRWLADRTGGASFAGNPTRVDVGVIDAWSSLGARDISPAVFDNERDLRKAVLHAAEALRAPAGRVIAVELAFDPRPAHWLGVEVARSIPDGVVASESIGAVIDVLATLRT